jgi:hypothetical protein
MLLIILALFWVAILAPVVVRRFRDSGTERSIDSFHAEHEVLSRQGYVVAPAHRLDQTDDLETGHEQAHRPRLTVVHADDTYRSLETRNSWEEWSQDYDYERDENASRPAVRTNRYASAYSSVPREPGVRDRYDAPTSSNRYASTYSSVPSEPEVRDRYAAPAHHGSMRSRRKVLFMRTALSAVVLTSLYFVVGYSIIEDLAILAWVGLVGYVALALFSVSQGYLHESSLPIRLPRSRPLATIEPLYDENSEEFDSEFYDSNSDDEWRRESPSRYALG